MFKRAIGAIGKGINRVATGLQKGLYLFDKLPPALQDKIVDRGVDVAGGVRVAYSPPAREFLQQHGEEPITKLTVRREPIQGAINTALNLVTLGKYEQAKQQAGFDKMFHLSLIINDKYTVEKNEVIQFWPAKPLAKEGEEIPVALGGKSLTIAQLMENAHKGMGDDNFFRYSAFGNRNCQNFVDGLLQHSGLLTPQLHSFLFQPLAGLLTHLPSYTGKLAQAVTNLGALVDVAKHGK